MTQLDVNIQLVDMPGSIKSFVKANVDLSYTIIINSRLSHEMQMKAYAHEIEHINSGDYDKKCSADLIEFYAHL